MRVISYSSHCRGNCPRGFFLLTILCYFNSTSQLPGWLTSRHTKNIINLDSLISSDTGPSVWPPSKHCQPPDHNFQQPVFEVATSTFVEEHLHSSLCKNNERYLKTKNDSCTDVHQNVIYKNEELNLIEMYNNTRIMV